MTLEEVELAFDIGHCTALELMAEVDRFLNATPELWAADELAEIACLDRQKQSDTDCAPDLLRTYLAANPMPPAQRPRSLEDCGKAILKARLERYLDSEDLPWTICRMVSPIEQRFDYPAWLGNLYNECDWSEEDSTRAQFPSLRREAERLAKVL